MKRLPLFIAIWSMVALLGASSIAAEEIVSPMGPVILTISGDIDVTNVDDTLQFDRETFAALDASLIETSTVWTDETNSFQGVSLHMLTELLGIESGTLLATAINDYEVEIPVTDAQAGGPIIAYKMDGNDMSIREKGPLWLIYPYDSGAEYRTAVILSRSIWQLDRIEVVK